MTKTRLVARILSAKQSLSWQAKKTEESTTKEFQKTAQLRRLYPTYDDHLLGVGQA